MTMDLTQILPQGNSFRLLQGAACGRWYTQNNQVNHPFDLRHEWNQLLLVGHQHSDVISVNFAKPCTARQAMPLDYIMKVMETLADTMICGFFLLTLWPLIPVGAPHGVKLLATTLHQPTPHNAEATSGNAHRTLQHGTMCASRCPNRRPRPYPHRLESVILGPIQLPFHRAQSSQETALQTRCCGHF